MELRFIRKEKISQNDTYTFYFERKNLPFTFLPGQYLRLTFPNLEDERGNSRFFTISSSPTEEEYITITTRIIKSPFKFCLLKLQKGDSVEFRGPFGRFVLDENDKRSHIFIAGGIGITPFRSMIFYAKDKKLSIPMTLFASFSLSEDVIWKEELLELEKTIPNLKSIFTVTKHENSKVPWKGVVGRLDQNKFLKYISNPTELIYFIVGPTGLVESLKSTILELGVKDENIHIENFPGY